MDPELVKIVLIVAFIYSLGAIKWAQGAPK